jgi:HlyD family secretion protein
MKRLAWLALVVVVVATGVWAYLYVQSRGSAPQFRTARVERGPLVAAVSATGNLNAVITVQVGSQVSGQIKELLADFNTVVRSGQVIARIDPESFQAKVNQARAEVEASRAAVLNQQAQVERARADVENARAALAESRAQTARAQVAVADARRDLDRKTELFKRELIARSDQDSSQALWDSAVAAADAARAKEQAGQAGVTSAEAQRRVAEAQLAAARATVQQKQAALDQARVDFEHTTIKAPVDGVVVSRAVDVGQTVAASLQAPTLFTIAQDLTKMQVETSVDEADIGKVQLDGKASFTVDAFAGETFAGRVSQIRKAALVVQNVVTYTVVVAVDNPGQRLLPGMTANVRLVVSEKPGVLKVPNAALRFRPPGLEGEPAQGARAGASSTSQAAAPSGGAGGGPGGAPGGTPPTPEQIKERLTKELGLSQDQQSKLDAILQETRQQMIALRSQGLPEGERQAKSMRLREASRVKIREFLTPEQQARYDLMGGERRGGGGAGRAFVLGPDGKPLAVQLRLGITDGSATEVVSGDLKEGQEVLVGVAAPSGPPRPTGAATPPPGGGPRLRL